MNIQWYGLSCFKIQSKDLVIVTDPYGKESGFTPLRTRADLVLVSHDHKSHNYVESLKDNPFVIYGPGEYEKKGVVIKGIVSFHDSQEGIKLGPNTIYIVEIEGIRICHLGDLGHLLSPKQLDRINGVDILLIPVGEKRTLSVEKVLDIINEIGPRIVIPMHYQIPKLKDKLSPVKKFLSEMGLEKIKAVPKLSIKARNLPSDETKVILLKSER
jgi:L-ascorbate metabolism protein UlaG (beta-lactamase superfamily)